MRGVGSELIRGGTGDDMAASVRWGAKAGTKTGRRENRDKQRDEHGEA